MRTDEIAAAYAVVNVRELEHALAHRRIRPCRTGGCSLEVPGYRLVVTKHFGTWIRCPWCHPAMRAWRN